MSHRRRRRRAGVGLSAGLSVAIGLTFAEAEAADARSILADEAYGFCHDERYPLTEEEAAWCPLLPESGTLCPAFRSACTAARAKGVGPGGTGAAGGGHETLRSRGGAGSRSRGAGSWDREASPPGEAPEPEPKPEVEIEEGALGPFAQLLMWLIVGGMLIAILAQAWGSGRRRRGSPTAEVVADAPAEVEATAPVDELTLALTVEALLERAASRARAGELAAAVADGHAALIRRLAERGRIRLDPSRTNGDHVRALRAEAALYAEVRDVVRVVERVQFGHAPITRADVEGLLQRARSALSRLAALLLIVWTGVACQDMPDYPWSHSPSGAAGVIELLGDRGVTVEYRVEPLVELDPDGPALVVKDNAGLSDDEWGSLLFFVGRGGRVLIVGIKDVDGIFGVRPRLRDDGVMAPQADDRVSATHALAIPGGRGLELTDAGGFVLRADTSGVAYAAGRELGDGLAIFLADDRLLQNGALAIPDNGEYLARLVTMLERDAVQIVEGEVRALSGGGGAGGASDPFDAVARAKLTAPILQLFALVLLLYLWRGAHFGRPQDPPPPSRRRFEQHVEALARLYARAEARRYALRLYSGWALGRIQERFGGGGGEGAVRGRGLHALAKRIAARTGKDETEIMRLLAEAQHARDSENDDDRGDAEDMRVLRELGGLIEHTRGQR